MATAMENKVNGSDYVLYMRDKGASKTANKMLMCQVDFALNQTNNSTESITKCGREQVPGLPTREATIGGELAMPAVDPLTQDYIDIKALQAAFDSNQSYSFTLTPKPTASLSTGVLQEIDFDARFGTYNQTYPTEGRATFENTLTLDDAPVYSDFVATT